MARDRQRHMLAKANAIAAACGLIALALCALAASNGTVGPTERGVFHAINGLPQWLYGPMFLFQQTGNLIIAFLAVLATAAALKSWRLGAAGVGGLLAKLALERVVKEVVERQRPGTSIGTDVIRRGSVAVHGLSFVSGHAAITAVLAMLVTPLLTGRWRVVPWVVVGLNGIARIYVGAHNPLDVVGGVGLGLFIGGLANLALSPADRSHGAPVVNTVPPLGPR